MHYVLKSIFTNFRIIALQATLSIKACVQMPKLCDLRMKTAFKIAIAKNL